MNLLKRVLTAVVLIPIVLLIVLRAPVSVLALVAALVALLSVQELIKLAEGYGLRPFHWPTYVFVGLFFLFMALSPPNKPLLNTAIFIYTIGFAVAIAPFVFLLVGTRRVELNSGFAASSVSVFAFAYIALPLAFLVQIREQWSGGFMLLYLLVVVWVGDIAAYFVGRSLGRHLMSPRVSPKKTWEGGLASLIASILVGTLLYNYALPISSALLSAQLMDRSSGYFALQSPPLWTTILLSAAINIAAQLGDTAESLIKRGAGVKDSGTILPGHGGMLDRIDALLFAAPVLWYYAAWQVMQ